MADQSRDGADLALDDVDEDRDGIGGTSVTVAAATIPVREEGADETQDGTSPVVAAVADDGLAALQPSGNVALVGDEGR